MSAPAGSTERISRHRWIPLPLRRGSLLMWGREANWSYRVGPRGGCTLYLRTAPDGPMPGLKVERPSHPSTLLRLLDRVPTQAASAAAWRLRRLCGGPVAVARADRAMARWMREDALALAGPGGDALATRVCEARALGLRNEPGPDPNLDFMRGPTSPAWAYGTLDPVLIGRRARTRTGRWPASDARMARIARGPRPVPGLTMLCALASLPEAWDPRTDAEWAALQALAEATRPLASLLGHFDFLAPSRGRWEEYLESFGGADVLGHLVTDAVDMARGLARQAVVPALFRAGLSGDLAAAGRDTPATAIAMALLAGDKGLGAIVRLSCDWHARRQGIDARAEPGSDGKEGERWPVPFGPLTAPNGVSLACVATSHALRDEGDRDTGLNHCVGSYVDACATGASVIVSLRAPGPAGRRLSTMELSRRGEGLRPGQHRGRNNAPPPAEAAEAAAWLVSALGSGDIPLSREYVSHAWRHRLGSRPYDARSDAAFARAVAGWSPLLSRPMRGPAAFEAAAVEACADLVRLRLGPGAHPPIGPLGVLSDVPLSPYPPPLRGDSVFAARIAAFDAFRAALGIAARRVPPGLRDRYEPVAMVAALLFLMVATGLCASDGLVALGLPAWLAIPSALALGPMPLVAPVLRAPGPVARRAFAARLRRARDRLAACVPAG